MNKISVGVVITTCDRHQDLAAALESLREQVTLPDEVVVVDDCSIIPVLPGIFEGFPETVNCKLINNEVRRGGNSSRNLGISAVDSVLTLFLDDDDKFAREKVSIIKAEFERDQFDVVYHPAIINYINYNISYISSPAGRIDTAQLLCSNCLGATSMVGIRTKLARDNAIFDERFPALQDWDAWLSLAVRGVKFKFVNVPLTEYSVRLAENSISKSVEKQRRAVALMDAKYSEQIGALEVHLQLLRKKNIDALFFLKSLLSRDKIAALIFSVRLLRNYGDWKYLLALFVSFASFKHCIALRAKAAQARL